MLQTRWSILIAFVPVGGFLADRLGRPNLAMASGFVIAGLAAVLLAGGASPAIPTFAIVALAIGLPAGLIMTLPATATSQQNRATGMGIYFTWYYALMAGFPPLAGFARNMTNNSGTPILFAATMMAAALVGSATFRLLAHSRVALVSEVRRQ